MIADDRSTGQLVLASLLVAMASAQPTSPKVEHRSYAEDDTIDLHKIIKSLSALLRANYVEDMKLRQLIATARTPYITPYIPYGTSLNLT